VSEDVLDLPLPQRVVDEDRYGTAGERAEERSRTLRSPRQQDRDTIVSPHSCGFESLAECRRPSGKRVVARLARAFRDRRVRADFRRCLEENARKIAGSSAVTMLRTCEGGRERTTVGPGHVMGRAPAAPRGIRERQFGTAPTDGLRRLLALAEPAAPLLLDHDDGSPQWFHRDEWRAFAPQSVAEDPTGTTIESFRLDNGGGAVLSHVTSSGRVHAPFDLSAAYDAYVSEGWAASTSQRRFSPRQLNTYYRVKRFIPRRVQIGARRLVVRWQGLPEFPAWPLDRSVVRLLQLYAFCVFVAQGKSEAPFRWFWPGRHHAALILTHDVESEEGVRLALDVADLEQELGFRSSFNVGAWYRLDPGVVRELTSRGFEIGVHGLRHDRSLFASRASFEAQQPALRSLIESIGAAGFRSPATHRVFEWIGELPVEYDCSIPHSDPFEPQPGGCCSIWPYFIGRVVELPYTLPQDHTLFTLLGQRTPALWLEQATRIEKDYGLIECLSHPDPGYLGDARQRAVYVEFLRGMAERRHIWRALPREVAAWWRTRDIGEGDLEHGLVRVGDVPDEVAFDPPDGS
jgi:hypothetical protein